MRILHVSHRYAPETIGGYEYNCQRFSEEWVRRGHEVSVLTRRLAPEIEPAATIGGVRVVRGLQDVARVSETRGPQNRLYQWRVALANRRNWSATDHLLRSMRFDAVVFWGMHSWLVAPILATRARGAPCCFDLGDYWLAESLRMFTCPERLKRNYRTRVLLGGRFDPSLVDAAVVHSRFMYTYYRGIGIPSEALAMIHRGIDDRFLEVGNTRSEQTGDRPVRILCVGRIVSDKGALTLVEAFIALQQQHPTAELHFYGSADPAYEGKVEQRCREAGLLNQNIFIHGSVSSEHMPKIYGSGDILVFPVLWDEPSSNVLLEAMAAGLPIIATDTGSNREFVQHERTGYLVERGDAGALCTALTSLCNSQDTRARMGQAGRALAFQSHRQQDIYDQTEAWLEAAARAATERRSDTISPAARPVATSRRTAGS